jgi:hypothetical protein
LRHNNRVRPSGYPGNMRSVLYILATVAAGALVGFAAARWWVVLAPAAVGARTPPGAGFSHFS